MRKFKRIFQIVRVAFILPGVKWSDDKLVMDINRWKEIQKIKTANKIVLLAELLWNYKEFRNLFIYRNRYRKFYRYWIRFCYKPMDTLYIEAKEIGGGLFIQHGFATIISAESIGENCWINQQVTIGYNGQEKPPIIGDRVMITCGAKVLGNITVGQDVVIGANAVVVKDVEPGSIMGGVPAYNLK